MLSPVTMRDRNNPYGPVRDAATARVAVLADQDSITSADVTILLIKTLPNRAHTALPLHHQRVSRPRLTDLDRGAKMGANSASKQATPGHNEPSPSQVNGTKGYIQRRLATAQA